VDCGTGIKKTVVAVAKDEAFCFYYFFDAFVINVLERL
jgi:cobyrinic acid a,c-diamide synthase